MTTVTIRMTGRRRRPSPFEAAVARVGLALVRWAGHRAERRAEAANRPRLSAAARSAAIDMQRERSLRAYGFGPR
ncbi:hypothetical protein OSC27_08010 [Microbacterium sp. STN6]|uniref:hypothetical protein n=1 Tax=Microbacterium sp. STN6 TaxID=2995588 RepID=UPI002260CF6A|nr:hypothetical protein [Microbacterium sp. STN6]MCX7522220.1 hypothetical protein [Microbacterium sp. STN6]